MPIMPSDVKWIIEEGNSWRRIDQSAEQFVSCMAGGAAQQPLLCGHAARLDHDFGLVVVFELLRRAGERGKTLLGKRLLYSGDEQDHFIKCSRCGDVAPRLLLRNYGAVTPRH